MRAQSCTLQLRGNSFCRWQARAGGGNPKIPSLPLPRVDRIRARGLDVADRRIRDPLGRRILLRFKGTPLNRIAFYSSAVYAARAASNIVYFGRVSEPEPAYGRGLRSRLFLFALKIVVN